MTPQSPRDPRAEAAAADPVVALGAELQEANETDRAAAGALDRAEGKRWLNTRNYVSMPVVEVGNYCAMSEKEIRVRCQPDCSDGPTEAERDRLITKFRDKETAYTNGSYY